MSATVIELGPEIEVVELRIVRDVKDDGVWRRHYIEARDIIMNAMASSWDDEAATMETIRGLAKKMDSVVRQTEKELAAHV